MLSTTMGYSYRDLTIIPSIISTVKSRSECDPFYKDGKLPIFASPMASVVNCNNAKIFEANHITPIIPRNIPLLDRLEMMYYGSWVALSLSEFRHYFVEHINENLCTFSGELKICVDIANGHMEYLYTSCKEAKTIAKLYSYKLIIMTGNIANPETYRWICDNANYLDKEGYYAPAVDYIRVGIGGGSGCITTSNVSIHMPQATLIDRCKLIKDEYCQRFVRKFPQIIADGGIRNYDDVIKALALGADYVMIGSLFSQCIESAGSKFVNTSKLKLKCPLERYKEFKCENEKNWQGIYSEEFIKENIKPWSTSLEDYKKQIKEGKIDSEHPEYKMSAISYDNKLKELHEWKWIGPIDVKFFGMASADGQKAIDGEKKKTAEGITKYLPVKYTLPGWVENMISYLRSAMSYCNSFNIEDFKGKPTLIVNSISEIHAVNK